MSLETCQDPFKLEIGVDEAGYGSYYGRVYAAAVVWPHDFNHKLIRDSKKFSSRKSRETAFDLVKEHAISYGIGYREAAVIDKINVLEANMQAIHEAIDRCRVLPDKILVDGNKFVTYWDKTLEPVEYETVTKGDQKYCSIAAASILAKVSRDRWIIEECERNPDLYKYGIEHNMGYGSAEHNIAIRQHGITSGHRQRGYGSKFVEGYDPAKVSKNLYKKKPKMKKHDAGVDDAVLDAGGGEDEEGDANVLPAFQINLPWENKESN